MKVQQGLKQLPTLKFAENIDLCDALVRADSEKIRRNTTYDKARLERGHELYTLYRNALSLGVPSQAH